MAEKIRPVIGLPTRYEWQKRLYNLRETYSDVIYHSGGVPLMLPLIPERDYIESVVNQLDAICLTGSDSDIDPLRYGAEPRPGLGTVVPRRDETDLLLLEVAEERRLPVLGICFGAQSLNVHRGGTLIQDIPSDVKNALKHSQEDVQQGRSHSINITESSLLADLAGATRAFVNSHHHQAIDVVGNDLEPIAWSMDGVVEAVINTRPGQFLLGVQWHPESGWREDELSKALFKHFMSVALQYARGRRNRLASISA